MGLLWHVRSPVAVGTLTRSFSTHPREQLLSLSHELSGQSTSHEPDSTSAMACCRRVGRPPVLRGVLLCLHVAINVLNVTLQLKAARSAGRLSWGPRRIEGVSVAGEGETRLQRGVERRNAGDS